MNEELKYSDNALLNKDIFFDNEINFYVEDEGQEYRYETIFSELFGIEIESIFALGGKNNLKIKYEELKKQKKLNTSFFIADMDFDFLLKKDIIENPHFIYLEKYEIENYIVDENAIIRFLKNELECMESKAKSILKYDIWIKETYKKLYKLFIMYLIVQKYKIELHNTKGNENSYFSESGSVNKSKIDNYYNILKQKLLEKDKDIEIEIQEIDNIVKFEYGSDMSKLIKGKYLIIGIRKYLSYIISSKTKTRRKVNEKFLIDYLFDFFDKSSLLFIKNKVDYCLKNNL